MKTFTIHGTRGSMSAEGKQFMRYGGATTSFSLLSEEICLIIDAGSGLQDLSEKIRKMKVLPEIHIFFTHFHLDHLIGLPVFSPLYQKSAHISIHYEPDIQCGIDRVLQSFISPPFWPVAFCDLPATLKMKGTPAKKGGIRIADITVSWKLLQHPQNSLGYKIAFKNGKKLAVLTDYEHGNAKISKTVEQFVENVDYLIYDAQYLPDEYPSHIGWGHSTWVEGCRLAKKANVKNLLLTHHDRLRTDEELDKIGSLAKLHFRNTQLAFDGMKLIFKD
jgi:ribonuclease BN (tRNA processing enzyme)